MAARTQQAARRLMQEIEELEILIEETKKNPHDPDMRWARDLLIYRIGCLNERLKNVRKHV